MESSDADLPGATSSTNRNNTYVSVDWLTLVQEAARTDRDQVLWNGQSGLCTSFTSRLATKASMANEVPRSLLAMLRCRIQSIISRVATGAILGKLQNLLSL